MKRILSLALVASLCLGVAGCGEKPEKSDAAKAKEKEIVETFNETKYHEENDRDLVFEVVNATNCDFGAIALIDPKTQEQVLLDGVQKEQNLSLDITWPKDVPEMNWAVYDTEGNLYMEGLTKLEEDKSHVILTLEGTNTVEHVETEFID